MSLRLRDELERLYRTEGASLWRAVAFMSGDPEVASDVVAEAFAQALARGDEIRSPKAWVWSVAFRLAARELKDRATRGSVLPERTWVMPGEQTSLFFAIHELSPTQRTAVILHYYAGYSQREIAGIIGSSTSAVGVHLYRARRRLRHLLEEGDE